MCRIKSIKINWIFFALFFVFSFAFSVSAQTVDQNFRLTASPLPINLKTDPGNTVTAQLKIKNDGNQDEKIAVDLKKFTADHITGAPKLLDREDGENYFDWVKFSENEFILNPNEWKTITLTINVPADAAFDYYYAVVFKRVEKETQSLDKQTFLTGGMATFVTLEVNSPNAKREVAVTDFSLDKKWYEFLPVNFAVTLRNTGNVHVAPRGNIFISKGANSNVAILEVNKDNGAILPNSPRTFTQSWSEGFPHAVPQEQDGKMMLDDNGNQVYKLEWNWADASKLRWGKYTAKLLLAYDDGKRDVPVEGEISFWVIPWRIMGGAFLLGMFILIGFKATLQNIFGKFKKPTKKVGKKK